MRCGGDIGLAYFRTVSRKDAGVVERAALEMR